MRGLVLSLTLLVTVSLPAMAAESCPGHPGAIGTSRTITVDPAILPRIGKMQYHHTLPLDDHEVVITFDDGPLPPYTNRVLDTLAENCVKVTYFLVGEMARAYPDTVRRIFNEGHVIGTHSLSHPFTFHTMGEPRIENEVNGGIALVTAALGESKAVAPFFRVPGLARSSTVEAYLASRSLAVWSADEVADDWHHGITAKTIVRLAMKRIEANDRRGVLLLHDIHPATALALPMLLKKLKENGYKIVQAVPPGERPQALPVERPEAMTAQLKSGWPRVLNAAMTTDENAAKKTKFTHRRKHRHAKDADEGLTGKFAAKKKDNAQTAGANYSYYDRVGAIN